MIALIIILSFCGCFCFYHTSKKVTLSNELAIEKWLSLNKLASKILGTLICTTSFVVSVNKFGTTAGILYWFILISITLCTLIIVSPMKIVHYKHIIFGFIGLLIIQLLSK